MPADRSKISSVPLKLSFSPKQMESKRMTQSKKTSNDVFQFFPRFPSHPGHLISVSKCMHNASFHFCFLTLCGTITILLLPKFKNRPMPKTINAICKQVIKLKKNHIRFLGCISAAEDFQYVCLHRTHCAAKG